MRFKLGYFILGFIISFAFKIDVLALNTACTQEEQLRLRQLASATNITFEFYHHVGIEEDYKGYKVSINNFTNDFYVYDREKGAYFEYDGDSVSTSEGFIGGIYNLPFYAAKGSTCEGYLILTKQVKLIPYNYYSENPLCAEYRDFELCKEFTSLTVSSDDEFKARLNAYIKGLKKDGKDNPIEKTTEQKTIWDNIIKFLTNNYMIFLIAIIVLGTTGIIVIQTTKRRSIL